VAARPAEPGAAAGVLARLSADDAARVLRPRALTEAASAGVVRRALGPDADDAFCATCHEVTRGNPFLLRELLIELRAEGASGSAGEVKMVGEMAPSSIGRAVLLRLARLPEDARRLAQAVAVLGDDCELRQAARLAGLELAAATGALDPLVEAGILEAGPTPAFVHPLVRNAIHADLAPGQRAEAHGRAARLLADEHAEPERVGLHLLAAPAAGDDAVVRTLVSAAQRALERAAPEAAMRYARRALAEPPSQQLRPEVYRVHALAGARIGDRALGEELGEDPLAELNANPDALLPTAWLMALWLMASGRRDEVPPLLERAVALASERGNVDLALQLEALLASSSLLSPAEARERFAYHADKVVPGTASERLWLALQSWWGTFLGDSAARTGEMARAALADGRLFAEQPDSPPPAQAILVLIRTEQLDLAVDRIDALAAEGRARGSVLPLTQAASLRALVDWLRGEVARAETGAHSAVEGARAGGWLGAVPIYLSFYVDILIDRGDLAAAGDELSRSGFTGPLPENYWWTPILVSRARLGLAQRRFEEAATILREIQRQAQRAGVTNPLHLLGSHLALALAGLGEAEAARRSAAAELERARAWGTPSASGAALRVCGLVAPREEGIALLEDAVSTLAASPVRLEYMRALADYGAALRRTNRRADARAPLHEALELARRGGALAIAQRAHDELAATGERLRPLLATGVESLTPSERRVAELAAEGLSNREIAQTLFLTMKTVEGHLSHAYRKLDIGSRRELAGALES
jgi:DNA-binding CsgD family transcriptional regulator